MSLSIGTLVGYLELDDTRFNRKADAADRKIQGLDLHLKALAANNPKLRLEVETQTKQLEELQAKIAALKVQAAEDVDVRVEMVAALAKLDALQAKIRAMHDAEVKVHVDDKGALAKLDAIQAKAKALGDKGGLFGSMMAYGPAFLPAINALPGTMFALGSGAVASAAGVGVLALAFHGLSDSVKAYQQYEAKLPFAQNAKQVAELKKTLALSAYGQQNASGRDFTRLVATKGAAAASGIKQSAQAGVFPGATRALRDILPLVPTVEHLMESLGHTVGQMTDETAKALNSPFWRGWFRWLGEDAKTQLPLVGSIFGHFTEGLMRGIQRFAPEGTSLLTWIDNLARRFDNWTGSPEFDKFIATTAEEGHAAVDALKPLGKILAEVYQGMSGAGTAELQIFGDVLDGMAHLPPEVFKVIGATLPVIFLGLKTFGLAGSIINGITKIGEAFTFLATEETAAANAGRGAAIAAGLLIVADAGQRTSRSMSTLQGAVGGALSGAGLGAFAGPEGAAIGAGVGFLAGGLLGLAHHTKSAGDAAAAALPLTQAYMAAIEGTAEAVRKYNLQTAVKNLGPKGLDAARALNIPSHVAAEATLGDPKALAQVDAVIARLTKRYTGIVTQVDAFGRITQSVGWTNMDVAGKVGDLTSALGIQQNQLKTDVRAANEAALAMGKYGKVLPGIPRNVQTRIDTIGLEKADARIVSLTHRYHLVPSQVRTILEAAGEKPTKASIQAIIDKAKELGKTGKSATLKPGFDGKPASSGLQALLGDVINRARSHAPVITPRVKGSAAHDDLMNTILALQGYANAHPVTVKTKGGKAAGGTVGKASGGTVDGPRAPYGDKVLTMLAPGEEVISNNRGQADRYRGVLKAINGMSGGGTVGDPLAGFGPDDVPGPTGAHHKSKKKSAAHAKAEHNKRLRAKLAAENKALTQAKAALAGAQDWSSMFAGNAFSADLSPYMTTVNAAPVTSIVNGMKVVQSGGAMAATPQSTLAAMLAYQKAQKTQADNLAKWVAKLRREGVSSGVLAQMQAAGPQGISEIQALASGSVAQVKQFNSLVGSTTSSLNNTGAYATTGHSYSELQRQQMTLQTIIKALSHALGKPVPVRVITSSTRP